MLSNPKNWVREVLAQGLTWKSKFLPPTAVKSHLGLLLSSEWPYKDQNKKKGWSRTKEGATLVCQAYQILHNIENGNELALS